MALQVTALFVRMTTTLRLRFRSESAATLVEYALLVALIAIALIVAVAFLGSSLNRIYNDIGASVANV